MSELGVKICGITTPEDALVAQELGADYLGMILSQGFSRSILPDEAVDIGLVAETPLVAVLVDESLDEAQRIAELSGASVIQLHGEENVEYVEELRRRGMWTIWKAVRVRDPEDVTRAVEGLGTSVDGLLLDGWHPDRPGGSGVSFSWEGVRVMRDQIPSALKVIVAGGLTPGNVADAVRVLRPDVVDVVSGVELNIRRKDPERIGAFVRNARGEE
ncbi:MAG: phosphoribosylanthranilate isomerase [Gemmatimonadota bacterium]|jgi:phosphoribosylanthranilate isomerase|nr:phosphoribosylanthranilate isomerase [Gemmatimonadota bacterium]HAD76039.1 N-(5'-phosphoribosyl)anthranilate isomerase [Gemmatimonadota bacterium]|tara:strand:- start:161 stop:808 length:648 start_codon:yes stop_codon:yes gene_type:complete